MHLHTHCIPSTLLNQRFLGRYEFKVGSGGGGPTCEQEGDKTAVVLAQGCKTTKSVSILLRGPSEHMLDEVERSLHDALCVIKVSCRNTVPSTVCTLLYTYACHRKSSAPSGFAPSFTAMPSILRPQPARLVEG